MHKIFISYSRFDYSKVVKLKDELERILGNGSCWIDLAGIESDRQFVDVIIDAIDKAEVVLFMYSKHSDNSEWTRKEIEYAYSEKKRIVFVKMENIQLSKYFRFQFGGHDIIDLNDNKQKDKLINNLSKWCGSESNAHYIAIPSEGQDKHTFSLEWMENHFVETLLAISLFLVIFFFLAGIPVFIGVNYKYRGYLKSKYPRYWNIMLKLRDFTYNMFIALNISVSLFFICFAFQEYDKHVLVMACVLFIASVLLTLYSCVSSLCCFKRKRTAIATFSVSAFLHLISILLLLYQRNNVLDSTLTLTHFSEQQDSITSPPCSVEEVKPDNETSNTNRNDRNNVAGDASTQSYCLQGDFDSKESMLEVTVESSDHIEGHMEQTVTHPEIFLSMHLNKRALSGVVENQDGTSIGYMKGLCEVKDSLLSIKGKISLRESDGWDYTEHSFSYMGIVPPSLLNELTRR